MTTVCLVKVGKVQRERERYQGKLLDLGLIFFAYFALFLFDFSRKERFFNKWKIFGLGRWSEMEWGWEGKRNKYFVG